MRDIRPCASVHDKLANLAMPIYTPKLTNNRLNITSGLDFTFEVRKKIFFLNNKKTVIWLKKKYLKKNEKKNNVYEKNFNRCGLAEFYE